MKGNVKKVDSTLWDSGHIVDCKDSTFGITMLRGDNCMHIRWNLAAHAAHEKTEFGSLLACVLMQNLYCGANG